MATGQTVKRVRDRIRGGERGPELVEQLRSLGEAVEACTGRVDQDVVGTAQLVVERADRRLAISGNSTVVALAGATGSGKSSTFNALTGTDLAGVGIRRPTTSAAMACSWGADSAEELLDWLEVPRRHALETDAEMAAELDGLVLIDLPDHDSTERAHRTEVDRLVQLVDMLVWVLDPQKYADAALHDRYLKPLAQHCEVMLIVLNQIDRLGAAELQQCLKDLRRLLDSEGLGGVEIIGLSAVTGDGLDALRARLARSVADKQTAAARLSADVAVAAAALAQSSGVTPVQPLESSDVNTLNASLAVAAGVPVVTEAVGNAWRLRGGLATGWPLLAWMAKFKPDPLRRLHLDRLGAGRKRLEIDPGEVSRTSLPATTGVQQARVDSALRSVADEASVGMTRGWTDAIKTAARSGEGRLADQLDRSIAATDLDLRARRGWWQGVRVLQWLLVGAIVAGLVWLGARLVLAYLQLPPLPKVFWWGVPAPTVLLIGGVIAGLVLAGLARIGVEVGARRRAVRAGQLLRKSIGGVTKTQVIEPVRAEQDRYERARLALERARH